jgi:hypothetical protein
VTVRHNYVILTDVIVLSARRQLAFDIWWLAFALWLICIIEVGHTNEYSVEDSQVD